MLPNEIPKDSIAERFYNNKAVTWFQLLANPHFSFTATVPTSDERVCKGRGHDSPSDLYEMLQISEGKSVKNAERKRE